MGSESLSTGAQNQHESMYRVLVPGPKRHINPVPAWVPGSMHPWRPAVLNPILGMGPNNRINNVIYDNNFPARGPPGTKAMPSLPFPFPHTAADLVSSRVQLAWGSPEPDLPHEDYTHQVPRQVILKLR